MFFRIRIATGPEKEFCIAVIKEKPEQNALQYQDAPDNETAMQLLQKLQGLYIEYRQGQNFKITDYKSNECFDYTQMLKWPLNNEQEKSRFTDEEVRQKHTSSNFIIHSEPPTNQHKIYIKGQELVWRADQPQYHFSDLQLEQAQLLKTLFSEALEANPEIFHLTSENGVLQECYIHQPLFFQHYHAQLPPNTIKIQDDVVRVTNEDALQNGVVCYVDDTKIFGAQPFSDNNNNANNGNALQNSLISAVGMFNPPSEVNNPLSGPKPSYSSDSHNG